jgi:fatty acid desaturase
MAIYSSCRKPLDQEGRLGLRKLVARDAGRSVLTIAADWLVIVLAVLLSERLRSPWLYAVAVLIIARQMNALSELHHHAMHGNLFRRKQWNRRLQIFYSLPLGTTISSDLGDHMEHHRTYGVAAPDHLTWGSGYGLSLKRRSNRAYMRYMAAGTDLLVDEGKIDVAHGFLEGMHQLASFNAPEGPPDGRLRRPRGEA